MQLKLYFSNSLQSQESSLASSLPIIKSVNYCMDSMYDAVMQQAKDLLSENESDELDIGINPYESIEAVANVKEHQILGTIATFWWKAQVYEYIILLQYSF